MTSTLNVTSPLIPPEAVGKAIAQRSHIWQMDFLSADNLAKFAGDRGLQFWSRHVTQLWQMGILRADYVVQSDKARRVGFRYIGTDSEGHHLYADIRRCRTFPDGWASATSRLPPLDHTVQPYFHGFRYLVLSYLDSVLQFTSLPSQSLPPPHYFHALLDEHLQRLKAKTSSAESIADVDQWNEVASLAVLSEPTMYVRIFGQLSRPSYISESMQRHRLNEHRQALAAVYKGIGLDRIRKIREDLCWEARMLEPNEDVHTAAVPCWQGGPPEA